MKKTQLYQSLYLFYSASSNGQEIRYVQYHYPTDTWFPESLVTGTSSILHRSPSAVFYKELIYLFYTNSSWELLFKIFDGISWSHQISTNIHILSETSPRAFVVKNFGEDEQLLLFFASTDNKTHIYKMGEDNTFPNKPMAAPGKTNHSMTADMLTDGEIITVYLGYVDNITTWYSSSTNQFSSDHQVIGFDQHPITDAGQPFLMHHKSKNELWLFHSGDSTPRYIYTIPYTGKGIFGLQIKSTSLITARGTPTALYINENNIKISYAQDITAKIIVRKITSSNHIILGDPIEIGTGSGQPASVFAWPTQQ